MWVNIDATLNPRKIGTVSGNKIQDIRMAEVQMADHCTVFPMTTATEYFIEC